MPDEIVLEAPKTAQNPAVAAEDQAPAAEPVAAGKAPADAAGADDVTTPEAIGDTTAPAVRFKGWRGGLLIELPEAGEWAEVAVALAERMAVAKDFWEGAPATIALAARELAQPELEALVAQLREDFGLEPAGIVSTVEAVRGIAETLELAAHEALPLAQAKPERPDPRQETRYLKGTIRSGMVVESPGNLVVVGDVNAGAEIRAGGDIVVMGTLRGVAHAGFGGNLLAQILAINLRPTQLRIGDLIARSPDGGQPPLSKFPEKAVVEHGEIHVLPL